MATQTASKPIDLVQLQAELNAASIAVSALLSTGGDLGTNATKDIYGIDATGARFDLPAGAATVITNHAAASTATRTTVLTIAQGAVGVAIGDLTLAQTRALLACLLYKQGSLNSAGVVQPLAGWL